MYVESKTKKNFCHSSSRKKVRISIGNFDLFAYPIFKNIEILSDQGVIQIEPNSVWSITFVPRVSNEKKKFCHSLPRKKVSFSYGILQLFQINCNY